MRIVAFAAACMACALAARAAKQTAIFPGQVMNTTDGQRISARGAGFLVHEGVTYWYGQFNETKKLRNNAISAYSSKDFYNWKFEGVVFRTSDIPIQPPAGTTLFMERPKVLRAPTGDFVLYFKLMAAPGSVIRQLGVASAPTPTGPFKFVHGVYPAGQDTGDLTVYANDARGALPEGQPGHVVAFTGQLRTSPHVAVAPLVEPSLRNTTPSGQCSGVKGPREGEALFWDSVAGQYTLVTSHTTGWAPNPSEWYVSKELCGGEWTSIGNRAVGSPDTFGSQSTFALELGPGKTVLMLDRWASGPGQDLNASTYVWLPVLRNETDGLPYVRWFDRWDLSVFGA